MAEGNQPAPGQVVTPGGAPPAAAPPDSPAPPQPPAPPVEPPAAAPPQAPVPADNPPAPAPDADAITWSASEFIAHDKTASWYLGLTVIAVVVAALVYFLTRDFTSTLVVLVGAFCLGVLGARKPKQQQYQMTPAGIQAGKKYYSFDAFRSFSVTPDGAFSSIVFMPLKRFAPLLTVYYDPKDEDRIVGILSGIMPYEEHKADAVDNLMKHIRF